MKIEFIAVAEAEFEEAIDYYTQESEGLGFEFAAEVKQTLERILEHPEAWTQVSKRTRRCRTQPVPIYGVIYQKRADKILIIAIMHFHRNPETWKSRIKKL